VTHLEDGIHYSTSDRRAGLLLVYSMIKGFKFTSPFDNRISMSDLLRKGISKFREVGLMLTIVAAVKWFKNTYEPLLYEKNVRQTAQQVGSDLAVNGEVSVNQNTVVGDNVNFNGLKIRGDGSVTIGDNSHSGPECMILTRNHNYDDGDAVPYDDTYVRAPVTIGDNVWFGARVTIIPGVTIGEGAIIQAASTVTDDIPQGAIAGGHPAQVFSQRDMEHYETLKSKEKFH